MRTGNDRLPGKGGRRSRAYTTVELLVVLGIVALLLAIAFTAGRSAIAAAKTRACASNLRQIGYGLALYAHDSNDRYPPYAFQDGFEGGKSTGRTIPAQPRRFKEVLSLYGVADDLFYCPQDADAHTDREGEGQTHRDSSYQMSIDYLVRGHWRDGAFVFSPVEQTEPERLNVFDDLSLVTVDEDGRRTRTSCHGSRQNALKFDGHVAFEPIVQP